MPPVPKKGELNKSWGLYVERPFFIVSTMDSGRYVDLIGNNMVLKRPNGFPSQQWWFDQKTKTIKSWRTKSYSWTVSSGGKGSAITVGGTNSRPYQLFKYDESHEFFYNVKDGRVLTVGGGRDEEGNRL
jgi:hypothetical protein